MNVDLSSRELVAIHQSLIDEIDILDRKMKYTRDDSKFRNRKIICEKALCKVKNLLHRKDFEEAEEAEK